eukprot:TRINITY_DN5945_c1_g1_i1.p1 TRINITY_DN5945_c1_g1~~TRINITY_DN5945_c1_g1_i1.p1  ORF type:complete len:1108 (+),score=356.04 TRINITY_DN5945_c1_g1_i1:108-3431(+)
MSTEGRDPGPDSPHAASRPKVDFKKYRGLLDNINHIKDQVEHERRRAANNELVLKEQLAKNEEEASHIQKELSVQLRCAGRSYQQLLDATRTLSEELIEEKQIREREKEPLFKEIKILKNQLAQAAKPWKEEVAKRDLKIVRLQEAAAEQEIRLREAMAEVEPVRVKLQAEIDAEKAKLPKVQADIEILKDAAKEREKVWEAEVERVRQEGVLKATELTIKLNGVNTDAMAIHTPYRKQIKELELKVSSLEAQALLVDYTPYQILLKERVHGYNLLVKDFRVKEQVHNENTIRMREGFEEIVKKLDFRLNSLEKEYDKKIEPWPLLVKAKEEEIEHQKKRVKDVMATEAACRAKAQFEFDDIKKELEAAKEAIKILNIQKTELEEKLENMSEGYDSEEEAPAAGQPSAAPTGGGGSSKLKKKLQALEMKLEDVVKRCEVLIRGRDRELKEKLDMITKLQKKVYEQTKINIEIDDKWEKRVVIKEEGYGIVVAQLKYAEGQILEEREKTKRALKEIQRRDELIAGFKVEHTEELRVRAQDRSELEARIEELEDALESLQVENKEDDIRKMWEVRCEEIKKQAELREASLEVEVVRRDRAKAAVDVELADVRLQFDKARTNWESKERELEVLVKTRNRLISALKNEIELVSESWEVKYNKLMSLFDKLQTKYDELLGPGHLAEALRRARDLKVENVELQKQVGELKEIIKKQKKQIRDFQLDIDIHMKETADLIMQKERGIAEMVGDYAKLEAKFRSVEEAKEKILQSLQSEKRGIVNSFKDRILQLEQLVEAMRFTDREELLDTIDTWKRAYERIILARDELEENFLEQMLMKDRQLRRMAEYNSEDRAKISVAKQEAAEQIEAMKLDKKRALARQQLQIDELTKVIGKRDAELALKDVEIQKHMRIADSRLVDPEKDALRKQVEAMGIQINGMQAGIDGFIAENAELNEKIKELSVVVEMSQDNWEPQIRWRDERYKAMCKEHEQVKAILWEEMRKAQDTCKAIEAQVRAFPNPFEDELKELKDKYAQMQAGQVKLAMENVHLKEKILDIEEAAEKEIKYLHSQIVTGGHLLESVTTLNSLKQLSRARVSKVEKTLGVDINGDGKIG